MSSCKFLHHFIQKVCGEHRESGILKRGFVASASCREGATENGVHAADGIQGLSLI